MENFMKASARSIEVFKKRRKKVICDLKDGEMLILFSAPVSFRQHDITYPYRQDSYFYYLTGFEEPEACLILSHQFPQEVLFVRDKNKLEETWEGYRLGVQVAKEALLMDETFNILDLEKKLPDLLNNIKTIYTIRSIHSKKDSTLDKVLISKKMERESISLKDASEKLNTMRMIKEKYEIEQIKQACEVSKNAHIDVMKSARPGMNELHLYSTFLHSMMMQDSVRESYGAVFACADRALTLHYSDNNQICNKGDMILVDAGAEWEYYASDITRTFPIDGRFTKEQKILYQGLLDVQNSIIDYIKPSVSFLEINNYARQLIYDFLNQSSILTRKIKQSEVKDFFNHTFGHFLGLDVHDVHYLKPGSKSHVLEPNMVITVEPGIYISNDMDFVKPEFRGVGLRIEDDILVTKSGFENLSKDIPKEIKDIESIMQHS